MSSLLHKCKLCNKLCISNNDLEEHTYICNIINACENTTSCIIDEIPSQQTMFNLIIQLINQNKVMANEICKLKNEINNITKNTPKNKQAITKVIMLNNKFKPSLCVNNYFKNINTSRHDLLYIFENDHINGISNIIIKYANKNINDFPIKCYEDNKNIFYAYIFNTEENINVWKTLNDDLLYKLIIYIIQKLQNELKIWKQENIQLIENDEAFYSNYMKYLRTVMGNNFSKDKIIKGIKKQLYDIIKINAI